MHPPPPRESPQEMTHHTKSTYRVDHTEKLPPTLPLDLVLPVQQYHQYSAVNPQVQRLPLLALCLLVPIMNLYHSVYVLLWARTKLDPGAGLGVCKLLRE